MDEKLTLPALRLFLLDILAESRGRHARSTKKLDFSVTFFHKFIHLRKDLIEMYQL